MSATVLKVASSLPALCKFVWNRTTSFRNINNIYMAVPYFLGTKFLQTRFFTTWELLSYFNVSITVMLQTSHISKGFACSEGEFQHSVWGVVSIMHRYSCRWEVDLLYTLWDRNWLTAKQKTICRVNQYSVYAKTINIVVITCKPLKPKVDAAEVYLAIQVSWKVYTINTEPNVLSVHLFHHWNWKDSDEIW